MEREGLGGFELLIIVSAGIGLALVGAVWAGAALALVLVGGGGEKKTLRLVAQYGFPSLRLLTLRPDFRQT